MGIALIGFQMHWGNQSYAESQEIIADKMNMPGMNMASEEEIAHPFFTHMGVPEALGSYSLRVSGLATRAEGKTEGDFAFHFETGLTKFFGLHIRNDRFLNNPRTEVMLQFAALRSADGMSGFSPYIEFEVPTLSGAGGRIPTLFGFSTSLENSKVAFNQSLEYNTLEEEVEYGVAFVTMFVKRLFPVVEVIGEVKRDERPIVNMLGGLKVRLNKNLILGVATQVPVTSHKDFSAQYIFQTEIIW